MRRFRIRLTMILTVMIGITVLGAGIFAANELRASYIQSLEDSLIRELNLILMSSFWDEGMAAGDPAAYFTALSRQLRQETYSRVTFIDRDGIVLGDSDHDPAQMDNHLAREEIQDALRQGDAGSTIRYSNTVKENMLYTAVSVHRDGELQGFIRMSKSIQEVHAYVKQLWSYLLLGLLLLFLAATLVSYRIAHGLTRPLEKVMQVAGQISNSNYLARVPLKSRDEFGQLGLAINTMADSLQKQMNHIKENESRLESVLENMNSGVFMIDRSGRLVLINRFAEEILGYEAKELLNKTYTDTHHHHELSELVEACIADRSAVREEVTFYYPTERILDIHLVPLWHEEQEWGGLVVVMHDITAIRRLEKMRSEFVANVSHELKTPIAAVKGFAETLLAGAVQDPKTAESFLQIIYDESERLDRLIVDILELSKIESKRIPLQFSPLHLKSFTERIFHVMKAQANKKQIELEMDVSDDIYLEADEDRLRQIFINLLSNGINYTGAGGRVKVSAVCKAEPDTQQEYVHLSIADTGIGIPKKDLPRIFERFYRVDKARSRSSGGTGLGLSIVKHLVELHKGRIHVESEQGMGTTFVIELPVLQ
ncbi:PAS domain-containing protein [Xylanibacillus composti]|uniref:histidine kinase n=1 Tax=Xylanibacillus composti TaxID=1572762 RepID=A0A8J4M2M6_9BACL|nr:ATP-binding protein [Xylanibacillus composti]MDT9724803.1 PAS domain-containing protein [Xylanibacillus composti]GIQ69844.1 PAS domain-containing sensor histidine kinase [Xylanibacillus composti]